MPGPVATSSAQRSQAPPVRAPGLWPVLPQHPGHGDKGWEAGREASRPCELARRAATTARPGRERGQHPRAAALPQAPGRSPLCGSHSPKPRKPSPVRLQASRGQSVSTPREQGGSSQPGWGLGHPGLFWPVGDFSGQLHPHPGLTEGTAGDRRSSVPAQQLCPLGSTPNWETSQGGGRGCTVGLGVARTRAPGHCRFILFAHRGVTGPRPETPRPSARPGHPGRCPGARAPKPQRPLPCPHASELLGLEGASKGAARGARAHPSPPPHVSVGRSPT